MTRAFFKCIAVAFLWGLFQSLFAFNVSGKIMFSDIILMNNFLKVSFILVSIIDMSIKLLPFILFQILFGTYIYQHYCTASVYFFSRFQNRVQWFLKECLVLYGLALVYPIVIILSATAFISMVNGVTFDKTSFILLLYYGLLHSLWLFLTALLMNILAIKLDSSNGFIVVASIQLICVATLMLWDKVWPLVDHSNVEMHALFLKFNPISHLILSWHSSPLAAISEQMNTLNIDFSLNTSVIIYLFISLVVVFVGCIIVKTQELISLNREGGI